MSKCAMITDRLQRRSIGVNVSGHKYKIGQLVNYRGPAGASGVYQITQLLPPEGDTFQYRIKNSNEPHERVVKEHELERGVTV